MGKINLVLLLCLAFLAGVEAQSQRICRNNCEMVPPGSLTYCAGLVDYTTCISEGSATVQEADQRAYNQSLTIATDQDCGGKCEEAKQALLCGLYFPKCNNSDTGGIVAQFLCNNTCYNFFTACNSNTTYAAAVCDRQSSANAPSDVCTGIVVAVTPCIAAILSPGSLLAAVVLVLLLML